ncbi:MAG: hypothetical protein BWY78_00049 [Alphaproteobacteria bacterium ADurb.Bin438]|nr:MAG: hypothetical protein BWY78_00049 [Alphaproteobacteria bacterium ADurb.Bin438]
MTKEDLEIEIELNHKAYKTLKEVEELDINQDLKDHIILMCETVMEDTNKKINEYQKVLTND